MKIYEFYVVFFLVALVVLASIIFVLTIGIKHDVDAIHNELELYEELNTERFEGLSRRVEILEDAYVGTD